MCLVSCTCIAVFHRPDEDAPRPTWTVTLPDPHCPAHGL